MLLVARLVPENTVAEFLDAAERIAQRYPVVVVGSSGSGGPLEARVRSLSASNRAVTWLGHLADDCKLYSLWQNCGAYFHGHSVGGTNPALVQAMACGAPIIARDTIFNREVLQDAGLFVEPNFQDIADAVETLMTHSMLQESLSSRAQTRAGELYSWEAICTQYETALYSAMDMQYPPSRLFRSASVNPRHIAQSPILPVRERIHDTIAALRSYRSGHSLKGRNEAGFAPAHAAERSEGILDGLSTDFRLDEIKETEDVVAQPDGVS